MSANNVIRVTDLNFDSIKNNLKGYLSSQTEFVDYDFESSTLQILLNLLAYNTYYQSFYLNMVGNEMFLDSATLRSSVVSHAKSLGYTPRTFKGSKATVLITIDPDNSPVSITIPKDTLLVSTVDTVAFNFVTTTSYSVAPVGGIYSVQAEIVQGAPLTFSYTVSTTNSQRYVIPNDRVDSESIVVTVVESSSNNFTTTYTRANNLTEVKNTSTVYFLEENENNQIELKFGDGVIGKALTNGNIINIAYRVTLGTDGNGISNFTVSGDISGYTNISVSTVTPARGGANAEIISSIKFNAPRVYESQNRAVTAEDYKRLLLTEFSEIQSISVWGGEFNTPPIYGKVYISCKPFNAPILPTTTKTSINLFLESRKVVGIEPEIVDATYVYVEPIVSIFYNPLLTSLTSGQILNKITSSIISYEFNQLGTYEGRFIHSDFVEQLANSDRSIVSADVKVRLQKRFVPNQNVSSTYTFSFNRTLLSISGGVTLTISPSRHPGVGWTVSSSSFGYEGFTSFIDDDGFGNVRIYYLDTLNRRVYLNYTAGTVDYDSGVVVLNAITITTSTEIQIAVVPRTYDVSTVRNQLLLIAGSSVVLRDDNTGEVSARTTTVNTEGGVSTISETAIINVIF